MNVRFLTALILVVCLVSVPKATFAKKGEKNFRKGVKHEAAQQWEQAVQELVLAVAAEPANMEYQMHFRRASFNASQTYMQQGRSLAERGDFELSTRGGEHAVVVSIAPGFGQPRPNRRGEARGLDM